jgi:putative addiction module killer protein
MYSVKLLPEFAYWLANLSDGITRRRLAARLRKATLGNLGDTKPVGEGVREMREHFGPGWRMYYVLHGTTVVVMLGGGDKSTQASDIAVALQRAAQLEPLKD